MNKTNVIRAVIILITIFFFVVIISLVPPMWSYNQPYMKTGSPTTNKQATSTIVKGKIEVSKGIKKLQEEREQHEALILKLQADNLKLTNEKVQLKEDRDEAIIKAKKAEAKIKFYDEGIKNYLIAKDKNLDYNYSILNKDTSGQFEFYNNLNYRVFPNKKDTVVKAIVLPPDTVKLYRPFWSIFGLFGKDRYKPLHK